MSAVSDASFGKASSASETPSPSESLSSIGSPVTVTTRLSINEAAPSLLPGLLVISSQMGVFADNVLVSAPRSFSEMVVSTQAGSLEVVLLAIDAEATFTAPE